MYMEFHIHLGVWSVIVAIIYGIPHTFGRLAHRLGYCMWNSTYIRKSFGSNVEIEPLIKQANDVDTTRKFSVYVLFMLLAEAASGQWKGYRDSAGK